MHDIDLMLKLQLEGKQEEAREISDRIESHGPAKLLDTKGQNTQEIWMRHCFNRGWFKIQEGRYQEGCQLLENGRYLEVYGAPPIMTTAPIYNPSMHDIRGKSVLISLEGGLGDEIIHARFATSFKNLGAEKVYLVASPSLHSLLSRIDGVDGVVSRQQVNMIPHDYWLPGFSAGWLAGHEFDDSFPSKPYLTPNNDSLMNWSQIIRNEKIKVGIRWAGNPKFEHQQFRLFPPAFLTNLSKYKELKIYSLQRDNNLVSDLPEDVVDLQHLLLSWEDTAAAIANLDLVITSCTSVAHLSAALGKETWVMVPILPYHTWTYNAPMSTTSPYYDSVRLFRQTEKEKWNLAFQDMYQCLEEKFNLIHQDQPNEDVEVKKLNLTGGRNYRDGFLNVDSRSSVRSDQVVDLSITPWPWKDDTFRHIVAKDFLEYIGNDKRDLIKILEEIYRVSSPDAVIEIEFPHHRCDSTLTDPDIKHLLTLDFFSMLDHKFLVDRLIKGETSKALSHRCDFNIVDVKFSFTKSYEGVIKSGKTSEEEINNAISHLNNVVKKVVLLIQVQKPMRTPYQNLVQLESPDA